MPPLSALSLSSPRARSLSPSLSHTHTYLSVSLSLRARSLVVVFLLAPSRSGRCAFQGPIFFYLGNEADVGLYVNATGLMWEHAARFGALMVFAEHRYDGQYFTRLLPPPSLWGGGSVSLFCCSHEGETTGRACTTTVRPQRGDNPLSPLLVAPRVAPLEEGACIGLLPWIFTTSCLWSLCLVEPIACLSAPTRLHCDIHPCPGTTVRHSPRQPRRPTWRTYRMSRRWRTTPA